MKYSVIDISSNSLSYIVAEAENGSLKTLLKDRTSLSMPYYMSRGKLTARGKDKLTDALGKMKTACSEAGADKCYVIATAALRNIDNFAEAAEEILAKTGLTVNLVDGETEAYCDYEANAGRFGDKAVLVDLGGKSTEICALDGKSGFYCLDTGLIDLRRRFVGKIQPTEKEAKKMGRYFRGCLDDACVPKEGVFDTVVLVGATDNAVAEIYFDSFDGAPIERKKFSELVRRLITGADRSELILKTAPEKVHLIIPAAIALKKLFKRFGAERIVTSDVGVKEGYLMLALRGGITGSAFDFAQGKSVGDPRSVGGKPAGRRGRPRKNAGAATGISGRKTKKKKISDKDPHSETIAESGVAETDNDEKSARDQS